MVQSPEAAKNDDGVQKNEQAVQQPRDGARPAAETNRQSDQNKADAREQQNQPQAGQQQSDRAQRVVSDNQPTLHEQKIKASIEERRRGDVDQPQAKAESNIQPRTQSAVKARMDVMAEAAAAKSETLPTAAKLLSGDKAAEGVGRFLLSSGQGGENSGSATAGHASTTSTGSAGSTGATSGAGATTSAPASTFADALAASMDAPESLDSAAKTFRAGGGNGRYHVTMQLDPPELGQLRVQVRMQNQGLTLQVDAESSAVAKLIESRISQLREALAAHGIRVERADVVVKSPSGTETNTQHQQQSGQHSGTQGAGDTYGDLPGDGRQATGSDDESRQGAAGPTDVYENNDGDAGADAEAAARGWMNRTASTELTLDLVA